MAGTVHTQAYKALLSKLIELRHGKGWSQAELARVLGKPPSFVGKYELGERRLDVIETEVICRNLGSALPTLLEKLDVHIPENLR